jgi:prepilin-type N-terminal cleavage/methylation domain-containing protein
LLVNGVPRCRAGHRFRRAFTLVEVVIGMFILGFVVLALYAALGSAFNVAQMSRENLRVTQVLIEKMEIMRLYSWDQITDPGFWPKLFTEHLDPAGVTNGAGGGIEFQGKMWVRPGPNDVEYRDDIKTVTIEVKWQSGGLQRSRQFETYLTKNGLQSYYF